MTNNGPTKTHRKKTVLERKTHRKIQSTGRDFPVLEQIGTFH